MAAAVMGSGRGDGMLGRWNRAGNWGTAGRLWSWTITMVGISIRGHETGRRKLCPCRLCGDGTSRGNVVGALLGGEISGDEEGGGDGDCGDDLLFHFFDSFVWFVLLFVFSNDTNQYRPSMSFSKKNEKKIFIVTDYLERPLAATQ